MCGIFGYTGRQNVPQTLVNGLRRLEYRGYDSWGIATLSKVEGDVNLGLENRNSLNIYKKVGKLPEEVALNFASNIGIAHTRWATHGGVTEVNAHPHVSTDGSFALAQNGIVENYQDLKKSLQEQGYKFGSETDTEVIVRLLESELKISPGENGQDFLAAVAKTFAKLYGRNTIIIIHNTGKIFAIKNGSPLVVGQADDQYFLGSDYLSFSNHTSTIMEIADFEGVEITAASKEAGASISKFRLKDGKTEFLDNNFHVIDEKFEEVDKGGFPDFMLKEIYEQPQTILSATSYTKEELMPLIEAIRKAGHVYTIGCGTAYYAAAQIAYYLRKYTNRHVTELKGYEVDSYRDLFANGDLLIAISQSGETIDTLEPVELMQAKGGKVASLVNMLGSTMTKISDYPYYSRTGPEICVASTKAFTAQVSWGYLLAQAIIGNYAAAKNEIANTSKILQDFLDDQVIPGLQQSLTDVVDYCKTQEHFFVLGRGQNYQIALEGSLKVKEISYKHFEGFAAGELKHGVIALVDKGTPVFVIISEDEDYANMISAAAEVRARGAKVIGISPKPNELFDYYIQTPNVSHLSAVANVIPFQLISHHLGIALGNDVDKPRNLAKSVTVK